MADKTDTGGPALRGITYLDYMAGQVAPAVFEWAHSPDGVYALNKEAPSVPMSRLVARMAYEVAKEMLKARPQ